MEDVAVEILNQVVESIDNYFDSLSKFGYKKQSDVDKLIVLTFIEELLSSEMRYYITEEDYRVLEQVLNCLYGSSCLIPYPKYVSDTSLFGLSDSNVLRIRISDSDIARVTENSIVRFINT